MKCSDLRQHNGKNRQTRRFLALTLALSIFTALSFPDYAMRSVVDAANGDAMPLAETEDEPIAWFDFNDGTPTDKTGTTHATFENPDGDIIIGTEGNNSYLDLTRSDAYLSLSGGILSGLTEMTVEMRVKTTNNIGPNWAFYAAPDESIPTATMVADNWDHREHYLGILLNNNVTVERYANTGTRPTNTVTAWPADNDWHTIRVVFKISSTILSVDGNAIEIGTPYSLKDCVGANGALWFGRAGWVTDGKNEGFNGCIDDIRIWDHAIYEPIDEEKYIVTDRVTDPKYTTVNMFDYWITDQRDNDYAALTHTDNLDALFQGINDGHLFLFAGETAFSGGDGNQATVPEVGFWNRSRGFVGDTQVGENTITQNIVKNTLDINGYPVLALDALGSEYAPNNIRLKSLWDAGTARTESLDYLFDPTKNVNGKLSYRDVTGLFRINDNGYYEFRSWDTFAELNVEDKVFPKTQTTNNRITLYNRIWGWGLVQFNEHDGQFFPFNDWSDMFFADPSTGEPVQAHKNSNGIEGGSRQTTTDEPLNHYFGMTVTTKFQQPTDGKLDRGTKKEPMKFEFSGDDDIWIFIDDVLVGDLGGIHGWKTISIDFSTGEVIISNDKTIVGNNYTHKTTIYEMFSQAHRETTADWKTISTQGNKIFADNSAHELKFFYLERGNQFSNCNITFNLQEPIMDHIRKVDENGDPLMGAGFELYAAKTNDNFDGSKQWHTASEFDKRSGDPVTVTVSGNNGYASLTQPNGNALQYDSEYYILEETGTPIGYRKNPPIVLQYHSGTDTLTVVNKYETGAYASFLADWTQLGSVDLARYDPTTGMSSDLGIAVNDNDLRDGLAIIVPVGKINGQWLPVYGSNTYGWNTVTPKGDFVKALAAAAIMQAADPDTQDWYLRWNESERCLKGHIDNLPGDATRYIAGGDIELLTLFLPNSALEALGLDNSAYTDDDARYAALRNALNVTELKDAKKLADRLNGIKLLYTDSGFEKTKRTVIYVPNEQRELRVRKADDQGNLRAGAVFALFDTPEHAAAGKTTDSEGILAYGTTGENGELIFRANGLTSSESSYGYAKMDWNSGRTDDDEVVYWLKEITAPSGCALNNSLIRVEVGNAGIYANATGFDAEGQLLTGDDAANDGITVEASLDKLSQTLVKYAEGIVDETLTYITASKQTANSENGALDISSWDDARGSDADSVQITYESNGYGAVKFTAEDDYIRVMPRQTKKTSHTAKCDDLTGIDLDGLFSLINTVVVTDQTFSPPNMGPTVGAPGNSGAPNDPDEPETPDGSNNTDTSDEVSKPYDNPVTMAEMGLGLRLTIVSLSLIVAVSPLRKRGKHRK